MSEIVKNDKGFKVIEMSPIEARAIGFGIPGCGCVCALCNKIIKDKIYYVAVLNDCLDEACYKEWYAGATYYEDDADYEGENFLYICERLTKVAFSALGFVSLN